MSLHVPGRRQRCQVVLSAVDGSAVSTACPHTWPHIRPRHQDHRRRDRFRLLRLPRPTGLRPDRGRSSVGRHHLLLPEHATTWTGRQRTALRRPRGTTSRHVPRRARVLSTAGVTRPAGGQSVRRGRAEELDPSQVRHRTSQGAAADPAEEEEAEPAAEQARNATDRRARHSRRNSFMLLI